MEQSSEQKNEPPSKRKLMQARKKGEVAVSRELAGAVGLAAGGAAIFACGGRLADGLGGLARSCFDSGEVALYSDCLSWLVEAVAVIGGAAALGGLLALALQTGLRFHLKLQFSRLNPVRGAARLFSRQRLFDLLLMLAKLSLLGAVAWFGVTPALAELVWRYRGELPSGAGAAIWVLARAFSLLGATVLLCGLADRLVQKRRFTKRMRMSRQEVIRERKEQDGDPLIRSERRKLHRQAIEGMGFSGLSRARVVVVNPTRIAVALGYEEERDQAPWVAISGRGQAAMRIRLRAAQLGIPVIEHVPLARALIALDPGEEIPEELYRAAAEVIRAIQECEGVRIPDTVS